MPPTDMRHGVSLDSHLLSCDEELPMSDFLANVVCRMKPDVA